MSACSFISFEHFVEICEIQLGPCIGINAAIELGLRAGDLMKAGCSRLKVFGSYSL